MKTPTQKHEEWLAFVADLDFREPKRKRPTPPAPKVESRVLTCKYCYLYFDTAARPVCTSLNGKILCSGMSE